MFIIPCRFDPERPIIFECLDRIKKYHPGEKIVVVDSASPDKSYFDKLNGVDILDVENRYYGVNAFKYAWMRYQDQQFYYCIYDSLLLNQSIESFRKYELTTFRYFKTPPTGVGHDESGNDLSIWIDAQLRKHIGVGMPSSFTGVMGPMWMCGEDVMWDLFTTGLFDILPTSKWELCAMERIVGIVMEHRGYDPTNSIQGEMFGFFDPYDETYVTKVNMARS